MHRDISSFAAEVIHVIHVVCAIHVSCICSHAIYVVMQHLQQKKTWIIHDVPLNMTEVPSQDCS